MTEPTNKEMFNINSVRATVDSVGEWDGHEQLAADNCNRIQDAMFEEAPDEYDDDQLHELMKTIWDECGSRTDLLTITDDQISKFVKRFV